MSNSKNYIDAILTSKMFILNEIQKNFNKMINEEDEKNVRYYSLPNGTVGFVQFGEPLPLEAKEITKDEYNNAKVADVKSLTPQKYYWETESLKGTPDRMPPVEYHGKVITSKGTKIPKKWGMYLGKLGDYDAQMKEHTGYIKKWFKDNAPGEDFYKNNMFYSMGSDGLPKFNNEVLKNHIVGLHAEEANEYFAKKNNLLTNYTKKLTELKKTHDATQQRLKTEEETINKQYGPPKEEDYYRTGTGTRTTDYDPQGGLGSTLKSPTSGGIASGTKSYDTWVTSGGQKIYLDKLSELGKKQQTETKNYSAKLANEKKVYDDNLKKLNSEYIHPDFEWGIKKEDYELYIKFTEAEQKKWAEINRKKIEWSQKLWKEHNAMEQMGMSSMQAFGGPTTGLSDETIKLGNELYSLANQPVVNWVDDETLKKQLELQKLKVKTENLMLNQIYDEEVELIQMTFGKKTDKQKEEERLANRPWYVRAVDISNYDVHDWMMLISLTCFIIPGLQGIGIATRGIGLTEIAALGIGATDAAIISAAVDLVDAGIYITEGNWEMAGLSVLFAVVPFAIESQFVKRIGKDGLKKMAEFAKAVPDAFLKGTGNMTMEELYRYTKIILDDDVKRAIKAMADNSSEIINKMKGSYKAASEKLLGQTGSKILNDGIQTSLKLSYDGIKYLAPKVGSLGKVGMVFGGYMAMGEIYHEGIEFTNDKLLKTPKSVAQSLGLDWNLLKSEFHSDGSEKDNNLLKEALSLGWRPGIPVPLQFQTSSYKKWLSEQQENNRKQTLQDTINDAELEKDFTEKLKNTDAMKVLIEEETKKNAEEIEDWVENNDQRIKEIADRIMNEDDGTDDNNNEK